MKESLFEYGCNNKGLSDEDDKSKYEKVVNENSSQKSENDTYKSNNYSSFEETDAGRQAKNMFDKYKDYSQGELMQEFLSSTKERLSNGSLNKEQINCTISKLIPFLNDSQKEVLKGLINKLDV